MRKTDKSTAWKTKFAELCKALEVPVPESEANQLGLLKALTNLVERKFTPQAVQEALDESQGANVPSVGLQVLPPGVPVEGRAYKIYLYSLRDKTVAKAITILRLIHTNDLKHLQAQINELIGEQS